MSVWVELADGVGSLPFWLSVAVWGVLLGVVLVGLWEERK